MRTLLLTFLVASAALAGCVSDDEPTVANGFQRDGRDDAVVIAVIDSGFNPYHFDMLAEHMPQHLNDDPSDDLPLWDDPATWLPGHPGVDAFAGYERIDITTTPDDTEADTQTLHDGDSAWGNVSGSSPGDVHVAWFPGTKVIGAVNFGGGDGFAATSHGVGTSTVSVGNLHGACPECLLVFVNGLGEDANRWVEEQDWIDAQTNSWGYSALLAVRDRFYAGSDVMAQKAAVERGQAIFFSAGNGLGNTFTAPNPTVFSSQEGPDWIITVGAVSPNDGSSYTGHGKPADVAAPGSGYPSGGYGDNTTTTAEGGFGGTSNATPVTAGMYGKALYEARRLATETRMQTNGTIAAGLPGCADVAPDCPFADGELTYQELRDAVLEAAEHTPTGYTVGLTDGTVPPLPLTDSIDELTFLAEGAGSFFAKLDGDEVWLDEVARIFSHLDGSRAPDVDGDLAAWQAALSYCTQELWGDWDLGHADGNVTIPSTDPNWPVRTFFTDTCPVVGPTLIEVDYLVTDVHPLL